MKKTVALAASLLVVACCTRKPVNLGPARRMPSPETLVLTAPAGVSAAADTVIETVMRNVLFHVDDDAVLGVRLLRGRMRDLRGSHVLLLDDKKVIAIDIADAEIALTPRDLTILLNRYIFAFKGANLKDLNISVEGDHIVQTGTLHKVIDIPFEMTATLGVSPDGWIAIHPLKIRICSLDGAALLKAVGSSLQSMIELKGARGVRVKGNDLFIDPLASLPAPTITGRLTSLRVEGGQILMAFGGAGAVGGAAAVGAFAVNTLEPPMPAPNFVYFRGGSIQFGKLFMVNADLEVVDGDVTDPFDFYLDYYNSQLVAGYHISTKNFGLVTYMPDFDDLGTAKGRVRQQ